MVSNGPVLRNSMSKDEFSFSQSSALGSSKESGSHADFKFGSGNTDCEMNCNARSLAKHFMSTMVVAWSPVSHLLDRQNRVVGRRWREAGVAAKQSSGRSSSRLEVAARSSLYVVNVKDDVIN
nr:WD repeat-containing protein 44-like [Ipomoea trifida]